MFIGYNGYTAGRGTSLIRTAARLARDSCAAVHNAPEIALSAVVDGIEAVRRMPTALVIEDDFASSSALSHVLQREGFTVLTTADPEEATRFCNDHDVNIVLADIVLRSPLSGTDVARSLRQSCPEIPILFVSGTPLEGWSMQDFSNLESLLPGRIEFLPKPFTSEALAQAIANLLDPSYSDEGIRHAVASAREYRER